jgi:hypothetical protein
MKYARNGMFFGAAIVNSLAYYLTEKSTKEKN